MTRVPTHRLSPAAGTTSAHDTGEDWRARGACRNEDPELFWPVGETSLGDRMQIASAKAVCRACPVIDTCRQDALDNRIEFGVWGGLTESERRDLLHPATDACGTGAGRSRHRRAGTPVCDTCLTYEYQLRAANNLRNWQNLAPHLDRGRTLEEAAAAIGLGLDAARRARQAAQRQQQQTTAA